VVSRSTVTAIAICATIHFWAGTAILAQSADVSALTQLCKAAPSRYFNDSLKTAADLMLFLWDARKDKANPRFLTVDKISDERRSLDGITIGDPFGIVINTCHVQMPSDLPYYQKGILDQAVEHSIRRFRYYWVYDSERWYDVARQLNACQLVAHPDATLAALSKAPKSIAWWFLKRKEWPPEIAWDHRLQLSYLINLHDLLDSESQNRFLTAIADTDQAAFWRFLSNDVFQARYRYWPNDHIPQENLSLSNAAVLSLDEIVDGFHTAFQQNCRNKEMIDASFQARRQDAVRK
jgi:hypothetical protein